MSSTPHLSEQQQSLLLDRAFHPLSGSRELGRLAQELIDRHATLGDGMVLTIPHLARRLWPDYLEETVVVREARLHVGVAGLVRVGVLVPTGQKVHAGGGDYYPSYKFSEE